MKHEYKGIRRILSAFKNSFDGFLFAFREEEAFRQDLLVFVIGLSFIYFLVVWGCLFARFI